MMLLLISDLTDLSSALGEQGCAPLAQSVSLSLLGAAASVSHNDATTATPKREPSLSPCLEPNCFMPKRCESRKQEDGKSKVLETNDQMYMKIQHDSTEYLSEG